MMVAWRIRLDEKTPLLINFIWSAGLKIPNMKYLIIFILMGIAAIGFVKYPGIQGREPEPWSASQLLAPSDLAAVMNNPKLKKPIIICVGPGALIKGSLDMGAAHEQANLEKLRKQLSLLSKDADIVIYCGCCPFEHCPNIRPAFILLNEMKFTNARLLNLEHNIKTDWVAKGFPVVKS
jgi:thiosulfate/3-mercaptopyruvate sulfurtransferase